MATFEYRQAQEVRDAFARQGVRYLFLGKSGAILLGFPYTKQDTDIYPEKSVENSRRIVAALIELGCALTPERIEEINRGKDSVQLRCGPFDFVLNFAPDGIERFSDAWERRVEVDGFPICHPDDIIASKQASGRAKDRESLGRLISFRDWWVTQREAR